MAEANPQEYVKYRPLDGFFKANALTKLIYLASSITVVGPVLFEGATWLRAANNKKAKTLLEMKDAKVLLAKESDGPVTVVPPGVVLEAEAEGKATFQDKEKDRETRVTISTPSK